MLVLTAPYDRAQKHAHRETDRHANTYPHVRNHTSTEELAMDMVSPQRSDDNLCSRNKTANQLKLI
eukprot:5441569-Amphidinium_carterae.1